MRAKFWGVRGSLAAPSKKTLGVGGNTMCLELRTATNALIVLDAGIGASSARSPASCAVRAGAAAGAGSARASL